MARTVASSGLVEEEDKTGESEDKSGGESEAEPGPESHCDRSACAMVKLGQNAARIVEPTIDTDSRDVRGRTLTASDGNPTEIKHDETINRNAEGILIALEEGVLIRTADNVFVHKVIVFDQYVDFSTGNIEFTGDVIVRKGVRDCFVIQAGGKVEVGGLIEAATIDCGGDPIARGGFAGREVGTAMVGGQSQ